MQPIGPEFWGLSPIRKGQHSVTTCHRTMPVPEDGCRMNLGAGWPTSLANQWASDSMRDFSEN